MSFLNFYFRYLIQPLYEPHFDFAHLLLCLHFDGENEARGHNSDPSGPVNPVNSCIFVAVLYFPVFCYCVLYFPVFLVDCTIVVVVDLCFHYILLFSVALFHLLMKYNV